MASRLKKWKRFASESHGCDERGPREKIRYTMFWARRKMARSLKRPKLPRTDSIQELANFWDSHDLTDYEDQLEEIAEPVFVRKTAIELPLEASEVEAIQR